MTVTTSTDSELDIDGYAFEGETLEELVEQLPHRESVPSDVVSPYHVLAEMLYTAPETEQAAADDKILLDMEQLEDELQPYLERDYSHARERIDMSDTPLSLFSQHRERAMAREAAERADGTYEEIREISYGQERERAGDKAASFTLVDAVAAMATPLNPAFGLAALVSGLKVGEHLVKERGYQRAQSIIRDAQEDAAEQYVEAMVDKHGDHELVHSQDRYWSRG